MQYDTAGDPQTGLKWTRKTTRKIAQELQQEGILVSAQSVGRILKHLGIPCGQSKKTGPQRKRL